MLDLNIKVDGPSSDFHQEKIYGRSFYLLSEDMDTIQACCEATLKNKNANALHKLHDMQNLDVVHSY